MNWLTIRQSLSYAGLQNFDASKIHVNNQQSAWGNQVREGELVKFRVKASNVDVEGATVIIKDAIGTPLYSLITNSQGYTEEVTLASNFYLDRNLNNIVGESNMTSSTSKCIRRPTYYQDIGREHLLRWL